MNGTLHDKSAAFFHETHAKLVGSDGREYEVRTLLNGSPAIYSVATGQTVTFRWKELVETAIKCEAAGLASKQG